MFTVWINEADVLPALVASPPYTAVMLCAPTVRVDVASDPVPPLRVTVPSVAVPFRIVTLPLGIAPPGVSAVTETVKATDCPNAEGFAPEAIATEVEYLLTVSVSKAEVLVAKFVSPV